MATFVLVHGAWAGGCVWRQIVSRCCARLATLFMPRPRPGRAIASTSPVRQSTSTLTSPTSSMSLSLRT